MQYLTTFLEPSSPRERARWRLLAGGIALALVLASAGCSPSVESIVAKAKAYHDKGDNVAAAIELRNVLTDQAKNKDAYFLAGVVLLELGDLTNAKNALQRAREYGYPAPELLPVLGRALIELESYQEVLDEITIDPKLEKSVATQLTVLRARAYFGQGDTTEARTQFLLVQKERPLQSKLGLARLAAADGNRAEADKLIEEAIALDRASSEPWMLRAEMLRGEGRVDDAFAAYGQAAKLAPRDPVPILHRAVILLSRDKFDEAKPLMEQAAKFAPAHPLLHFAQGLLAFKEKRYDDANLELQTLFEVMPRHYPGLLLAGIVNNATGSYDLAQNAIGNYLIRYPNDATALRLMGATLLAKGQAHLAVNVVDRPAGTTTDIGLIAVAAEANRQMGRMARAKALLEKAIELDPKNPEHRTNLGLVELRLGARDKAMKDLEAAIALNPPNARADEAMVMVLLGQKQLDRAEAAVDALEKRLPKSPDPYMLRGVIWLAKKDDAKARASFEQALSIAPTHYPAAEALADIDTREGKPDALRQRMQAILQKDPQHLGALLAVARLDVAQGRTADGIATVRRALSEHPESINALLMLAEFQLAAGQADEAVISARQAHDLHPYDARAATLLADAQLAAGDKQGAIITLNGLVGMQPRLITSYMRLGAAYMANNDVNSAAATALQALKVDPKNLAPKALLAETYMRTNRRADALALAMQIQKDQPKASLGYRMEADVLIARKNYAQAVPVLRKALALDTTGPLLVRMHLAQSGMPGGKPDDGSLRDWLKKNPTDVETRTYLAEYYLGAGRYRESADQYREVLKATPKDYRVLNNLAWALFQAGDVQSIEYAQQALQLKPDDAPTADTLGVILLGRGKYIEAVQALLKAVSLDGNNPEFRYHLVQGLLKVGDTTRAKSELKTLLATGRPFPQLDEARALAVKLGS